MHLLIFLNIFLAWDVWAETTSLHEPTTTAILEGSKFDSENYTKSKVAHVKKENKTQAINLKNIKHGKIRIGIEKKMLAREKMLSNRSLPKGRRFLTTEELKEKEIKTNEYVNKIRNEAQLKTQRKK